MQGKNFQNTVKSLKIKDKNPEISPLRKKCKILMHLVKKYKRI